MRRTANKEGDQGNAIVANQLINGRCGCLMFPYICSKVIQVYIRKDYISKCEVIIFGVNVEKLVRLWEATDMGLSNFAPEFQISNCSHQPVGCNGLILI